MVMENIGPKVKMDSKVQIGPKVEKEIFGPKVQIGPKVQVDSKVERDPKVQVENKLQVDSKLQMDFKVPIENKLQVENNPKVQMKILEISKVPIRKEIQMDPKLSMENKINGNFEQITGNSSLVIKTMDQAKKVNLLYRHHNRLLREEGLILDPFNLQEIDLEKFRRSYYEICCRHLLQEAFVKLNFPIDLALSSLNRMKRKEMIALLSRTKPCKFPKQGKVPFLSVSENTRFRAFNFSWCSRKTDFYKTGYEFAKEVAHCYFSPRGNYNLGLTVTGISDFIGRQKLVFLIKKELEMVDNIWEMDSAEIPYTAEILHFYYNLLCGMFHGVLEWSKIDMDLNPKAEMIDLGLYSHYLDLKETINLDLDFSVHPYSRIQRVFKKTPGVLNRLSPSSYGNITCIPKLTKILDEMYERFCIPQTFEKLEKCKHLFENI